MIDRLFLSSFQVHNALGRFPFDFNTSHDSNLVAVATLKRDGNSKRRIGVDVMKVRNPWEGTTTDEFLEGISAQVHLSPPPRSREEVIEC